MPILFSPVDGEEWKGAFKPYPRSAFLMFQDNESISKIDEKMLSEIRTALAEASITVNVASTTPSTGDFLKKILLLIRGSGFGVAAYSNVTPPRTLANIFFEAGVCQILGKPVYLMVTGDNPTPSDFVRTEWIVFEKARLSAFRKRIRSAFDNMVDLGQYHRKLGELALEAEDVDYELAFERFGQAILLAGQDAGLAEITKIQTKLRSEESSGGGDHHFHSHRKRLLQSVDEFIKLV